MARNEGHVLTFRCYAYPGKSDGRKGYFAECIDADLMVWRPELPEAVKQMNSALQGFVDAAAAVSSSHDEFRDLIHRPAPLWPSRAKFYFHALRRALPRPVHRVGARTIVLDVPMAEPQVVAAQ